MMQVMASADNREFQALQRTQAPGAQATVQMHLDHLDNKLGANSVKPAKPSTLATTNHVAKTVVPTQSVSATTNGTQLTSSPVNGVSPAVSPTNGGLIGILPNGVHVSRVGAVNYGPEVHSVLKKVLPTRTDAINAVNLTAQLTLQCMMNIKALKTDLVLRKNRPIRPRLTRETSQILELPTTEVLVNDKPELPTTEVLVNDKPSELAHPQTQQNEVVPSDDDSKCSSMSSSPQPALLPTEKQLGKASSGIGKMNDLQLIVKDCKVDMQVTKQRKRKQQFFTLEDPSSTLPVQKENSSNPPKPKTTSKRVRDADLNEPASKKACLVPKQQKMSSVPQIGYIRRMASLNARARVSAMMETDRKAPPKAPPKQAKSAPSSTKNKPRPTSQNTEQETLSSDIPSIITSAVTLDQLARNDPIVCAVHVEEALPEYNTLGLLYNGSTVHPTRCRVFYSTNNSQVSLPKIIIPLLVPSRLDTIGLEVEQALSHKRTSKKVAKGNNGWMALGSSIKTIEYYQDDATIKREYYIGIQRKKDAVFVRDCVVLRASSDEKPYVAKVGSIWKEDGALMMTLFWYYRPEEVDPSAKAGAEFKENELLASQHYDVNSVACIEEKCYILGVRQYCRYHAGVVGSKHLSTQPHVSKVPLLPSRNHRTPYVSHVTGHMVSHDRTKSYFDLGPTVEEVVQTDSSLVYLCYRGYNHISGRLYQL